MIWRLDSLFQKENTPFKKEGYASSKLIIFTWISIAYCRCLVSETLASNSSISMVLPAWSMNMPVR
jgi:hypothetical protein